MYKFVFYVAMSFILGIMLGNIIYSTHAEPTVEQCLSVCIEAYEPYNELYDYE